MAGSRQAIQITLSAEKSRPGGMTRMAGMCRPNERRLCSTRLSSGL